MNKKITFGLCFIIIAVALLGVVNSKEKSNINYSFVESHSSYLLNNYDLRYQEYYSENYYNNESIADISKKLDKYLNSTLEGKGEFIAKYSIKVGVDPYLVTAVILQETGCYWTCSYLTRVCNNVGGNKGNPGCNGGSYKKFSTLDEGIKFSINKLNNYYKKGLTTPEEIGPKYATSTSWASKVNNYIKKLKD